MNSKKIRAVGAAVLVALWALLTAGAWFLPAKDISEFERRKLKQIPTLSAATLLDGTFMQKFEAASLDQFPLRDTFRQLKSVFHYYGLQQKDNNGFYLADGHIGELDFPFNQSSLNYAVSRFQFLYDTYLKDTDSQITFVPVPDKGYYLAEKNGYPAMDYQKLFSQLESKLSWAEFVDITDCLTAEDYYFTDTHWRQEKLIPVAQKVSFALGVEPPRAEDFVKTPLQRPFYGVHYGQAALPTEPETIYLMENQRLSDCLVYNHETGETTGIYNMDKLTSRDMYDVYLSGASYLLTLENPNAKTDRELIVFRDSFGSSLVPLLVQDYKTVTLVDIRYIDSRALSQLVSFTGQDVLFLYSTLLLNESSTLK